MFIFDYSNIYIETNFPKHVECDDGGTLLRVYQARCHMAYMRICELGSVALPESHLDYTEGKSSL